MQKVHFYLSLIPQALIASMLPPREFGSYYAIGTRHHVRGSAIFFELDPDFRSDQFDFNAALERCRPAPDGSPKKSVYLGIYRVLSRIPVSALGSLYLTTGDGMTLGLERAQYAPEAGRQLHLYQEFSPVTPLVASRLEPQAFCRFITDASQPVHVPRIVFAELHLQGLATDPLHGDAGNLPYADIDHIRDVLAELDRDGKKTKLVFKQVTSEPRYRMIRGGLYVGDQQDFAFYRMPPPDELDRHHRPWWRSAQITPLI